MSTKENRVYRTCQLCRRTYNVSRIDPGGEVYICEMCANRARRFLAGEGKTQKNGGNDHDS